MLLCLANDLLLPGIIRLVVVPFMPELGIRILNEITVLGGGSFVNPLQVKAIRDIMDIGQERHLAKHIRVLMDQVPEIVIPALRALENGFSIHGERPLARCAEERDKRRLALFVGKRARHEPTGNPAASFRGTKGASLFVGLLKLATQQTHFGMAVEVVAHQAQGAGNELVIAIQEKKILRIRRTLQRAQIPRRRSSSVVLPDAADARIAGTIAPDDFGGGIRAAVIGKNQFPILHILAQNAGNGLGKKGAVIIARNDNRNSCHEYRWGLPTCLSGKPEKIKPKTHRG